MAAKENRHSRKPASEQQGLEYMVKRPLRRPPVPEIGLNTRSAFLSSWPFFPDEMKELYGCTRMHFRNTLNSIRPPKSRANTRISCLRLPQEPTKSKTPPLDLCFSRKIVLVLRFAPAIRNGLFILSFNPFGDCQYAAARGLGKELGE